MKNFYKIAYIIFVIILLCLPTTLIVASRYSEWLTLPKNKQITKSPQQTTLTEFISKTEINLENAIPFRDSLNSKYKAFSSLTLKQSNENAIVGQDDWLFYTGDDIFEDLMGLRNFSDQSLMEWYAPYIEKERFLRSKGIKYLLIVIPNKSTAYEELLPWWVKLNLSKTRMDQILEAKEQLAPNLDILDLSGDLERLKSEGIETYWYNDTHWSGNAFLRSLSTIFQKSQSLLPTHNLSVSFASLRIESFTADGDLVNLIGLPGSWPIRPRERLVFENPGDMKTLPPIALGIEFDSKAPSYTHPVIIERESKTARALIFHDSFLKVAKFSPDAVENNPISLPFGTSVLLWEQPTLERLRILVDRVNPDIVIEERVERKLIEGNLK